MLWEFEIEEDGRHFVAFLPSDSAGTSIVLDTRQMIGLAGDLLSVATGMDPTWSQAVYQRGQSGSCKEFVGSCITCGADDCETHCVWCWHDVTVGHLTFCPASIGVYPTTIDEHDMVCARCGEPFGESFVVRKFDEEDDCVSLLLCVQCGMLPPETVETF